MGTARCSQFFSLFLHRFYANYRKNSTAITTSPVNKSHHGLCASTTQPTGTSCHTRALLCASQGCLLLGWKGPPGAISSLAHSHCCKLRVTAGCTLTRRWCWGAWQPQEELDKLQSRGAIRRWWKKHSRKFWAAECDSFTEAFFLSFSFFFLQRLYFQRWCGFME